MFKILPFLFADTFLIILYSVETHYVIYNTYRVSRKEVSLFELLFSLKCFLFDKDYERK